MDDRYIVQKRYSIANGFFNLILSSILAICFYTYAFNNPDPNNCFANEATIVPLGTSADGYINISQKFRIWFLWGFGLHIAHAFNSFVDIVFSFLFKKIYDRSLVYMSYGFTICIGSGWLVMGCLIRWKLTGKVCSGDFIDSPEIENFDGELYYLRESG